MYILILLTADVLFMGSFSLNVRSWRKGLFCSLSRLLYHSAIQTFVFAEVISSIFYSNMCLKCSKNRSCLCCKMKHRPRYSTNPKQSLVLPALCWISGISVGVLAEVYATDNFSNLCTASAGELYSVIVTSGNSVLLTASVLNILTNHIMKFKANDCLTYNCSVFVILLLLVKCSIDAIAAVHKLDLSSLTLTSILIVPAVMTSLYPGVQLHSVTVEKRRTQTKHRMMVLIRSQELKRAPRFDWFHADILIILIGFRIETKL